MLDANLGWILFLHFWDLFECSNSSMLVSKWFPFFGVVQVQEYFFCHISGKLFLAASSVVKLHAPDWKLFLGEYWADVSLTWPSQFVLMVMNRRTTICAADPTSIPIQMPWEMRKIKSNYTCKIKQKEKKNKAFTKHFLQSQGKQNQFCFFTARKHLGNINKFIMSSC